MIQPNALIGCPIRNEYSSHRKPRTTAISSINTKPLASHIRVLVQRIMPSTTIEVSQTCESHPSPKTYATKSVNRSPKTTVSRPTNCSAICGIYRVAKNAANITMAMIALFLTGFRVRFAMYRLSNTPRTNGNHSTLDKGFSNENPDVVWFIGLAIGIVGFAVYAITANRFLSALFFGIAVMVLFHAFTSKSSNNLMRVNLEDRL